MMIFSSLVVYNRRTETATIPLHSVICFQNVMNSFQQCFIPMTSGIIPGHKFRWNSN